MELLLVRHALPERIELEEGQADPPLAPDGRRQAERLASYLAEEGVRALYTSPMQRARQTAAPVAAALGVEAVVDEGLAEYDRHHTSYIPIEQLKAEDHPEWRQMVAGTWASERLGVDEREFRGAVVATMEGIVDRHPGALVAVVCHGGVINAYLAHVIGLPLDVGSFFYPRYTSVHRVAASRSGVRSLVTINEVVHLRGTGLSYGLP